MKLTGIEMFKGLSNMELAKLLGMLDKQEFVAGTRLFRQGEPGDRMYIIESGAIELFLLADGDVRRSLTVLGTGEVVGEMALLTGEARSAEAITAERSVLYVIDSKMFDRLVAENAVFSAYFIKLLSQRLVATNTRLQEAKKTESERIIQGLGQLREQTARFLLWCAHVPLVSRELAEHTFHFSLDQELSQYPFLEQCFQDNKATSEWLTLASGLKSVLNDISKERYGYDEMASWIDKAVSWYVSQGNWVAFILIQGDKGDWPVALDTYARIGGKVTDGQRAELFRTINRCPRELLAVNYAALQIYLPYCESHAPETGLSVVESALSYGHGFSPHELLFLYECGTELCRLVGKKNQSLEYLQLADALASTVSSEGRVVNADQAYGLAKQKLARKRSELLVKGAGRLLNGNRIAEVIAVVIALLCIVLSFVLEPIGGLSEAGMRFIGITLAAVVMWIVPVVPEYMVALGMIMLWVLGGVAPPETALSGFGSSAWLFMIFIMAVSAVVMKSGIAYRISLLVLRQFPSHYRGQLWGIVTGGLLLNPFLPSSSAKVSIGVPMAQTLAESLGYGERSKGAAGLGLIAMLFFGFTAPFVMTGSYTNVMAYGLAKADDKVSWLQWLLYALPAFILFALILLIAMRYMFRKLEPAKVITGEVLNEQLRLLGPLTKDERVSMWTIIGCIGLMVLQPLHGIDSTWIMLMGFAVLVVSGVLDKQTLSMGIDWTFLLFLGAAFSFAGVDEQLGVSNVLSSFLDEHLPMFVDNPALFLIAVILGSYLVTLVIRDAPAVILLVTAIVPLGDVVGIHPWILVFIILLATSPFFFTYQSSTYLTAYYSAEGKAFSHQQAQKIAVWYGLAVLLAAAVSVPYWKWLHLIS
ncbi:SLC13 family permease [Paenibacillus sinopodophylli]|uniref:SLC13 family permease n=1 Tax=Paenibacillus sinopodophylli TaxID=1837342 RepID=UPI00110CCBD1|nr:SLC13 family permease [Paenibacillus sinopodophylli]